MAAQALRAGALTVAPEHRPNSVHGYFLRRGQANLPLDIHVERVRAGRTYTSRQIDVRQEDKTIFAMLASFHADEPARSSITPCRRASRTRTRWPHPTRISVGVGRRHPPRRGGRPDRAVVGPGPAAISGRFDHALLRPAVRVRPASRRRRGRGHRIRVSATARTGTPRCWRGNFGNFGSLDHALWYHREPVVDEWFSVTSAVDGEGLQGVGAGPDVRRRGPASGHLHPGDVPQSRRGQAPAWSWPAPWFARSLRRGLNDGFQPLRHVPAFPPGERRLGAMPSKPCGAPGYTWSSVGTPA